MTEKHKSLCTLILTGAALFSLSAWCLLKPSDRYSDSERRALASMPEFTLESVLSGKFMSDFEKYATDQFPLRDRFRTLKALTELKVFHKMDNNGIYTSDGHLSKLEYPMSTQMLDHAAERFSWIYETYLKESDASLYFSIVPDKNKFLADECGVLSMDYDAFAEYMKEKTEYMEYIDIFDQLSIEDYYTTDTHWRQECIVDIAETLSGAMGITAAAEYKENLSAAPFYGVYCGQSALNILPDTLKYLTNEVLDSCVVTSYDTGKPVQVPLYDMAAAAGKDPYEMFSGGSDALITIENPNAATDRELILFRDSFGSSIAPLFMAGYSKVTLVDIRYIQSSMLGQFIEFDDQDVLFLYSTLLLNNSMGMR